jgi:hypothetical protein
LLIKHSFPAQRVFESLGRLVDQAGVVIGVLDGGLRGDPEPGANAVHVNERRRVAKVDDNGGASANVSYQLRREPPIILYLIHTLSLSPVKARTDAVGVALWYAGLQIRIGQMECVSSISRHDHATRCRAALSRRQTVSFGQAIASSNGFVGAIDPTNPLTIINWG